MKNIVLTLTVLALLPLLGIAQVGINTNTPDPRVSLDISDPTKGIILRSLGAGQRELLQRNGTPHGTIVYDNSYKQLFLFDSTVGGGVWNIINPWTMRGVNTGNNANNMTLAQVGNVGIGTASPQYKLHVNGSTRVTSLYCVENIGVGVTSPNSSIEIDQNVDNGGIRIWRDRGGNAGAARLDMGHQRSGGFVFNAQAGGEEFSWNRMHFQSEGEDIMVIRGARIEVQRPLIVSDLLGIGITDPSLNLDVNQNDEEGGVRIRYGPTFPELLLDMGYRSEGGGFVFNAKAGGTEFGWNEMHFQSEGNDIMIVRGHQVDIARPLIVGDRVEINGNLLVNGSITTNDCNGCSDVRLKHQFLPITHSLDKINLLKTYTYYWKPDSPINGKDQSLQYGVIAQELEQVYPDLVGEREDGYKFVHYEKLSVPLIQAVKELSQQLTEKEQQIQLLEKRLEALEKLVK